MSSDFHNRLFSVTGIGEGGLTLNGDLDYPEENGKALPVKGWKARHG
jgi:hypothetical protein